MSSQPWFNSQLLRSYRRDLKWTQAELANRASLSLRVIAKAEAGNPVASSTIQALVQTLNASGKEVCSNDFTYDPRDVVQNLLYDCTLFKINSVPSWHSMLADRVEVLMDGDPVSNPLAGKYCGVEEFEALLRKIFSIFVRDGGTLGDTTQMRLIDQEVVAWGHEYIRVPEAPPSLPTFVMLRIQFKNRLITHIDAYYEAAGLMSRLAIWAKAYPTAPWTKHFNLDTFLRCQQPNAPIRQMVLSNGQEIRPLSAEALRERA